MMFFIFWFGPQFASVGQLMQKGYIVNFDKDECVVLDKKNNHIVAQVKMTTNKVFTLIMPMKEDVALKMKSFDEASLWHLRLGHLNFRELKLLKRKNMVIGLSFINIEDKICK